MTAADDFQQWVRARQQAFEAYAQAALPAEKLLPASLPGAMRYSVLDGGKRIRPLLVAAAGEMARAPEPAVLAAGLAIECIHSYSLVHDDLPCMDNDLLRRGKPTTHARYGYAPALLAGDALQAEAFSILARAELPASQALHLVQILADAAGVRGMCGGQALDIDAVGCPRTLAELRAMHEKKTGAILTASVLMGLACGAPQFQKRACFEALAQYGAAIGLAFQIVDDILDVTASTEALGKTAGKDAHDGKPTYVSLLGLEAARRLAGEQHEAALAALASVRAEFPELGSCRRLEQIAGFVVRRNH